ncbi:heat shock protein (htpX) [Archaeoglobus fulgidus DSM 4304]|jgi:heat shock protein HtpX|uniref:Protease HtpX homolog n=4 Tax=Archaeoglobaceae TaxID=2232 RepID=HTPX_ARCFU|nr:MULTISPECIES: zinc metalloprotease HtpX [Archaeoglobus]O30004.1 RecName: Full=Protease HtpX homolog [Archaeoglobus fulgidus DSM 4304]AAB90998.1 heat shock protein (htpX) [Archaeoglobus fulgidus DSM 4304]AIG97052.1 Zn-dependent protease with chaperone function [Archaeoglobus fulgidus DSM 8774]KUJ94528.1 MAG: Protease HtpX-like protein [Archaeoglobus fulgidus]KUK07620.1 MAG: Protease HtpX-like protein [Archaeoglobus fulgidus]MDI3497734.1 heat shock protein HtpX [Archaeoglobus sp.]
MMLYFFDPVYMMLAVLGYFVMLLLASTIAPKVASRVSGKFSLFTSMVLLAGMILAISAAIIYLILAYAGVYISFYGLIIFLLIINLLMYLLSPYIINLSYGAQRDERLQMVVNSVARRLNVKPPKAVVVRSPPNAFAYGNFLTGKFVAVSESLMRMLSQEELEAVIGHEIGHHKHRDNAVMLLFGLLPSVIFYLGYALLHSSMRDDRRGAQLAAIGIAAVIVSFIVQILVLAFSRLREYYADFEGVRATNKDAMQRSLAKIHLFYHRYPDYLAPIQDSKFRTLFIYAFTNAVAEPITRADIEALKNMKVSPIQEFLSTHPPLPKRLRFIESIRVF